MAVRDLNITTIAQNEHDQYGNKKTALYFSDGNPVLYYNGYANDDIYAAQVARGNVTGANSVNSFGELKITGSVTDHVIHPSIIGNTINVPPEAGLQLSFQSTSSNDTSGGTGINSIHIHYLDGNLDQQEEILTLNGTTGVNTVATDIRFVQCIHIQTVGSNGSAAGDITGTNGGLIYTAIVQGKRRCSSSARRVPNGKRLMVKNLYAGSASATADTRTTIRFVTTYIEGHDFTEDGILFPQAGISLQNSSEALVLDKPFMIPSGVIVALETTANKAATINGGFIGYFENA